VIKILCYIHISQKLRRARSYIYIYIYINNLKNFLSVILLLHIKYPVIKRKQSIPVFPHMPNIYRNMVLALYGDVTIGPSPAKSFELTTKWCATIIIMHTMRYNSKLELLTCSLETAIFMYIWQFGKC
jgi:hypothetical protein